MRIGGIIQKLKGGDLRSIGKAQEVVNDVLENPSLFGDVFEGMLDSDPVVRMRSADVIEKVSKMRPEYLQPFKSRLLKEVCRIEQKEVRWHLAQIFSYLDVNKKEVGQIMKILSFFLERNSSAIVRTFSIQTLTDLAEKDASLRPEVIGIIENVMKSGSPAIISRGKRLIKRLKKTHN